MKKIFFIALSFVAISTFAQDNAQTYYRKFLFEHFTTAQCGYCPYAMYIMTDYIAQDPERYIWVSHHSGFGSDKLTIPENSVIENFVGSNGAPNMSFNRTTRRIPNAYKYTFHPGYLPQATFDDAKTAEASVTIQHTFDNDTRALEITVAGQTNNTTDNAYLLSVLIKESNIIEPQADQLYSWNNSGWREYVHTRAVRDMLTASLGDTVSITNQSYSKTFSYTIPANWNADNCCIVAYITPLSKAPIINAEQAPLVAGTQGGEQYYPMGITNTAAPSNSDKLNFKKLHTKKVSDTQLELMLISDKTVSTPYGNANVVALLYLNTIEETLPTDTLDILDTNELGTFTAGSFDSNNVTWHGSRLTYVDPESLSEEPNSEELIEIFTWQMNTGKVGIDQQGNIIMAGYFSNKKHFTGIYNNITSDIPTIIQPQSKVQKYIQNGQLIIQTQDKSYNINGAIIGQ